MITGPSGSGKEILSRYVHDKSPRAGGPFVAINCAAIPDTMLESTLFGYEKGAFTGAVQACPGKFEQAQGGTILLDEITEMDLSLQAKLLRVLQEREVERLGSRKSIALDVRVIATSNRDLRQAVAEHKFREDLYYRLNVFPLHWRSLKDRPLDIVPIARFLLEKHAREMNQAIPEISDAASAKLSGYSFPGNVRELDNIVQRALILCNGKSVSEGDIIFDEQGLDEALQGSDDSLVAPVLEERQDTDVPDDADGALNDPLRTQRIPANLGGELKQQEFQIILDALIELHGNRQAVAEKLGISPRTLRYKIAKMRDEGMIIPG